MRRHCDQHVLQTKKHSEEYVQKPRLTFMRICLAEYLQKSQPIFKIRSAEIASQKNMRRICDQEQEEICATIAAKRTCAEITMNIYRISADIASTFRRNL
jgi:hypothetical protein